jgi:tRNA (mo5U34)-methyltransferase
MMVNSSDAATPLTQESLQARVDDVKFWWHSIDLGQGVVTPGAKDPAFIARELESLRLPPLRGKTVLDIGAYDGYYTFAAERLGADRVVALDHFVWATDLPRAIAYWRDCKDKGVAPLPVEETAFWQPERLPGKRAFDTAHAALRSRAEVVVGDFMTMDIAPLGAFDVSFFMGVLYHMKDPLESMRRLAQVTRELAVIETHAVAFPGYEHLELCEFYSANQLNGDSTNWWGPNLQALKGMCLAAGFSRVDVVSTGASGSIVQRLRRAGEKAAAALLRRPLHFRAVVHAWK